MMTEGVDDTFAGVRDHDLDGSETSSGWLGKVMILDSKIFSIEFMISMCLIELL